LKSDNILEKIKKNIIIHHYEYVDADKKLECEIFEAEKHLHNLKKQRDARITIYLPESHPILSSGLKLLNLEHEWSTHFTNDKDEPRQRRELVYIDAIKENADVTGVFDEKEKWVMNYDGERYYALEGFFYGRKSILKLSGLDKKDLK
jgi:hypothetical protein